jgi:hypothetical protein
MDDARRERNVAAPQAERIALSVRPLVVKLDDREMGARSTMYTTDRMTATVMNATASVRATSRGGLLTFRGRAA